MNWLKRRWARIGALISIIGAAFANTPYSMGQIANYIPQTYKVPAFIGGLFLFCVFQLIQSTRPKVKELPEQIIHIHHYYEKEEKI